MINHFMTEATEVRCPSRSVTDLVEKDLAKLFYAKAYARGQEAGQPGFMVAKLMDVTNLNLVHAAAALLSVCVIYANKSCKTCKTAQWLLCMMISQSSLLLPNAHLTAYLMLHRKSSGPS